MRALDLGGGMCRRLCGDSQCDFSVSPVKFKSMFGLGKNLVPTIIYILHRYYCKGKDDNLQCN